MRNSWAAQAALLAMLLVAPADPAGAAAQQNAQSESIARDGEFGIEDYFRLHRFGDIALSEDGNWLAYSVSRPSLDNDSTIRRIYVRSLAGGEVADSAAAFDGARALAWIPGGHQLAFLSAAGGSAQVHSFDVITGEVRQLTRSADPVISFRFAPDGRQFAYASRASSKPGTSLYDQFRNADAGILIDTDSISSHDFVNPEWNTMVAPQPARLWVAGAGGRAAPVSVPGEPLARNDAYFWSADGDAITVRYISAEDSSGRPGGDQTSVGLFELASNRFRTLAQAVAPDGGRPGISYAGGQWLPGERRILLRRVIENDPWVSGSFPDWAIVDASGTAAGEKGWRTAELYPSGLNFFPLADGTILVENTVEGEHSLFRLTPEGVRPATLMSGVDGSSDKFSFSLDASVVAFVNQSLTRPPEIFVKRGPSTARQLTRLNEALAREVGFTSREVSWQGTDGVTVKGWLLEPEGGGQGPLPLVTHVHGGPAFPFPNAFAPYFDYWPYPLEVYPSRGIAVFLPNYRGTHTYGRKIAEAIGDDQALQDIVSGVESLVAAGVADPKRLGISGHSHGALVGPLAMAKSKLFWASSFAEGVSNQVVMYELMSGDANRYIHDPTTGVSLYQSPQTYIDASADLQLEGVSTASLFEAGAKTSAIFMLGLAKAAKRFGMPTDFFIYPKTAHNLAIPTLQKESAERNLDWFEFWLNGRENPDPSKREQYARWRQARSSR